MFPRIVNGFFVYFHNWTNAITYIIAMAEILNRAVIFEAQKCQNSSHLLPPPLIYIKTTTVYISISATAFSVCF